MFLVGRGPLGAPSSYHPILSTYPIILFFMSGRQEGRKGGRRAERGLKGVGAVFVAM
jgi:hypothetical protein